MYNNERTWIDFWPFSRHQVGGSSEAWSSGLHLFRHSRTAGINGYNWLDTPEISKLEKILYELNSIVFVNRLILHDDKFLLDFRVQFWRKCARRKRCVTTSWKMTLWISLCLIIKETLWLTMKVREFIEKMPFYGTNKFSAFVCNKLTLCGTGWLRLRLSWHLISFNNDRSLWSNCKQIRCLLGPFI